MGKTGHWEAPGNMHEKENNRKRNPGNEEQSVAYMYEKDIMKSIALNSSLKLIKK